LAAPGDGPPGGGGGPGPPAWGGPGRDGLDPTPPATPDGLVDAGGYCLACGGAYGHCVCADRRCYYHISGRIGFCLYVFFGKAIRKITINICTRWCCACKVDDVYISKGMCTNVRCALSLIHIYIYIYLYICIVWLAS
jgi:hypothetical protein